MQAYLPPIDCVRAAFKSFRPKDPKKFNEETGIKEYWAKIFILDRPGAKHPPYERIAAIIEWLERQHGVTFLSDGTYVVRPKLYSVQ